MSTEDSRRIVADVIEETLRHHRDQVRRARNWLAYTEAALEYYEEWARTGQVPEREYPKPQGEL